MPKPARQFGQFTRPPVCLAAGLLLMFLVFSQSEPSSADGLFSTGKSLAQSYRIPSIANLSVFSANAQDPIFDASGKSGHTEGHLEKKP